MAVTLPRLSDKSRSATGFSLIELLVAVAIVSLLAAIAIPQYSNYQTRSIDAQMRSDLKNAAMAMESYFADRKAYPNSISAITAVGFTQTDGVSLTITVTSPSSYLLTASKSNGTQPSFTYNSVTGLIN